MWIQIKRLKESFCKTWQCSSTSSFVSFASSSLYSAARFIESKSFHSLNLPSCLDISDFQVSNRLPSPRCRSTRFSMTNCVMPRVSSSCCSLLSPTTGAWSTCRSWPPSRTWTTVRLRLSNVVSLKVVI